ncbi:hypothetical protein [Devosia sp. 1635]|uniref:hypothetical protein n=1 Tax=Devosia sp. 1635 TaxID=2726066 RepID=UPI001AEE72EA|nr:hypothetical protein [Devosia sp. 1635]
MTLASPSTQALSRWPGTMTTARRLGWAVLALGVLFAAMLAVPGQTATNKYVNDLYIFLDGAHRIVLGQVPNVDFHTSLGPLAFYLPAAGLALSGSLGAAMPVGMALVVLILACIGAPLIASRMHPITGMAAAVFLLAVAAVPVNPGEAVSDLSFAMFYNRIGWSALGLLLVMYLRPFNDSRQQALVDAVCAALLVLLMLYTKASYGLVGFAFLVFMLLDRQQRGRMALALGLCAISIGAIALLWGGTLNHVADLQLAQEVSGGLPELQRLAETMMVNLADLVVFALFAALLLLARRRFRDLLFVGFCASTGILIIEQNFQIVGILTLGAGAAVIAELLMREPNSQRYPVALSGAGVPLLLATLLLPVAVQNVFSLGVHAAMASSRAGEPSPLPQFGGVRLVRLWSDGAYRNFVRYHETLLDGALALESLDRPLQNVLAFDFVSPFAAGLDLPVSQGDSPWFHWGRTLDHDHFPPAAEIMADVEIIMDPKTPIEHWTADGMREIYADYIAQNFELASETRHWRVYVRRGADLVSVLPSENSSTIKQSTSAQP